MNYYAVIDESGRCYEVRHTVIKVNSPYYIPIDKFSINYLSKYYWPIFEFVYDDTDFNGNWYSDASHTIKEVIA